VQPGAVYFAFFDAGDLGTPALHLTAAAAEDTFLETINHTMILG
jgi:hypothetical protein